MLGKNEMSTRKLKHLALKKRQSSFFRVMPTVLRKVQNKKRMLKFPNNVEVSQYKYPD